MTKNTLLTLYAPVILLAVLILNSSIKQSTADTENHTHLIIQFDVAQQYLVEFSTMMENIESDMQSETGFVSARVYQSQDNPLRFTLFERWQSREDHLQHFDSITSSGGWYNILGLLQSPPKMDYFNAL